MPEATTISQHALKTVVTVVITIFATGLRGWLGNLVSDGWLIQLLGGVRAADAPTMIPKDGPRPLIAFIVDEKAGKVCPEGWAVYTEAHGRFLLGAGATNEKDVNGFALPVAKVSESGGEAGHQISLTQMPSHRHTFKESRFGNAGDGRTVGRGGGDGNVDVALTTDAAGGADALALIPPYVAVQFCIRE